MLPHRMRPHRAVLFDCDGVLVDSESLSAEVLSGWLSELGVELSSKDALRLLRGRRLSEWIGELYSREASFRDREDQGWLRTDFESEFRERVDKAYADRLEPEPHVSELLDALRVPWAVVSNAPLWKVRRGLACAGIQIPADTTVVSAYEVGSWKPEPDLFVHAARSLGVSAAQCVVVEDSTSGARAAVAAGATLIHYSPDPTVPTYPNAAARSRNHKETLHHIERLTVQGDQQHAPTSGPL